MSDSAGAGPLWRRLRCRAAASDEQHPGASERHNKEKSAGDVGSPQASTAGPSASGQRILRVAICSSTTVPTTCRRSVSGPQRLGTPVVACRIAHGPRRSLASPLVRVGQLAPVRRVLVAICAVAAAAIPLLARPASGQPAPDPGQQANDAAARYSTIETRYDMLGDQIAALEQKIQAGEMRRAELRGIAQRRAAVAYKMRGSGPRSWCSRPRTRAKARVQLLCSTGPTRPTTAWLIELGTLNAQLTAQRDQLASQQKEQQGALGQLNGLEANFAAVAAGGPVQIIDGMACPLPGAGFTDDFGPPRSGHSHRASTCTRPSGHPRARVVSGDVTYGDGGGGGMGAYIAGDDGNRYVYYHLSQYVGPPRHVSPGRGHRQGGLDRQRNRSAFALRDPSRGRRPAVDPFPTLVTASAETPRGSTVVPVGPIGSARGLLAHRGGTRPGRPLPRVRAEGDRAACAAGVGGGAAARPTCSARWARWACSAC